MRIKPGVNYPNSGSRIDGVRYGARDPDGKGSTWWWAGSRPSPMFQRYDKIARDCAALWKTLSAPQIAGWDHLWDLTVGWPAGWCPVPSRGSGSGGEASLLLESTGFDSAPLVFTAVQCWRADSGLPYELNAPVVHTFQGLDELLTLRHSPPSDDPERLLYPYTLQWVRIFGVLPPVEYWTRLSTRAVLSEPTPEQYSKDRWCGSYLQDPAVHQPIQSYLLNSNACSKATRIWVRVEIGERLVFPFFVGHMLLGNFLPSTR